MARANHDGRKKLNGSQSTLLKDSSATYRRASAIGTMQCAVTSQFMVDERITAQMLLDSLCLVVILLPIFLVHNQNWNLYRTTLRQAQSAFSAGIDFQQLLIFYLAINL